MLPWRSSTDRWNGFLYPTDRCLQFEVCLSEVGAVWYFIPVMPCLATTMTERYVFVCAFVCMLLGS